MRKIKIYEVRSILSQIEKSGVSGQGDIAIIKEVGHIGKKINELQWRYKTSNAGELTKKFNENYRIDGNLVVEAE